jgi:hypothetical protein
MATSRRRWASWWVGSLGKFLLEMDMPDSLKVVSFGCSGDLEFLLSPSCPGGDSRSWTLVEKMRLELIEASTGMAVEVRRGKFAGVELDKLEAGDVWMVTFRMEGAEKLGEGRGRMGDLGGVSPRPGSVCGES